MNHSQEGKKEVYFWNP